MSGFCSDCRLLYFIQPIPLRANADLATHQFECLPKHIQLLRRTFSVNDEGKKLQENDKNFN